MEVDLLRLGCPLADDAFRSNFQSASLNRQNGTEVQLLFLVKPETVVRWHRRGFRLFWRWKSRRLGRPTISREVIDLIRRMSRENPTWGVAQIEIRAPPLEQDSQVNPELAGRAGLIRRMTSSRRKLDPTRVPSVSEHTTLGAQRSYTATLLPDRSSPSRQSPQMGAGQFLLANT